MADLSSLSGISSALTGFVSAAIIAVWKLFGLYKDQAVLEVRITKLEQEVEKNAKAVEVIESRIMASLTRIEDRLNKLIDGEK